MSDRTVTITVLARDLASSVFDAVANAGESVVARLTGSLGSLTSILQNPIEGLKSLANVAGHEASAALSELGVAGEVVAGGLGAVAAASAAVAGAIFGLADSASHSGEEVLAFSQRTGIAIENVGALQFATKAAGGSLSDLTGILAKVEIKAAADDGGKFALALKDIGINADAFKKMDSEQQILALAKGFQEGAASGNTMAAAVAIMGKSGAENIPLLMKLTDELVDKGKTLGVQWSQENVKAAEDFSVGLNTIETVLGNVATKIGAAVLPAVAGMLSQFAESPGFVSGVTTAITLLAEGLGILVEWDGKLLEGTIAVLAPLVAVGTFVGTVFVDAWSTAIDWIAKFVGWFSKFSVVQDATGLVGSAFTTLKGIVVTVVTDVLTWLEKIPGVGSLVKDGIEKASSAFTGMTGAAGAVGAASDKVAGALFSVGAAATGATGAVDAHNRAHTEGTAAAAKYESAIQKLVDKLVGENQSFEQTSQAIDRVIASGNQDIDVKTRIVAEIDKLVKSHQTLTEAQYEFWNQNASLSKDVQKSIQDTRQLHDDLAIAVAKDQDGELAGALAANQKWYADQVDTVGKLNLSDDQRAEHLDALRADRAEKDAEAIEAQRKREEDFDDATRSLWDKHYAFVAGLTGKDAAAKNKAIDDQLAHEKQKLLEDQNITWPEYYDRIKALDANAQDQKDKNLKDEIQKEKIARDDNTLGWDGYYIKVAQLHKTSAMDVELQQVKDNLQAQLDALDEREPDFQKKWALYTADAAVEQDQIRQNYHDKAVQPMIDDGVKLFDAALHGWDSFKSAVQGILGEILHYFEEKIVIGFLSGWAGMLGQMASQWAGFGASLAGSGGAGGAGAAAAGGGISAGAIAAGAGYAGALAPFIPLIIGLLTPDDPTVGGGVDNPLPVGTDVAEAQALFDQYVRGHQGDQDYDPVNPFTIFVSNHPWVTGQGDGFAGGGVIGDGAGLFRRPAGLPASDTVPLPWATPGEGIVSLRGMGTLGRDGLDALNSGADLRGLFGGTRDIHIHLAAPQVSVTAMSLRDARRQVPQIAAELMDEVIDRIQYNRGVGDKTRMQVALGIA